MNFVVFFTLSSDAWHVSYFSSLVHSNKRSATTTITLTTTTMQKKTVSNSMLHLHFMYCSVCLTMGFFCALSSLRSLRSLASFTLFLFFSEELSNFNAHHKIPSGLVVCQHYTTCMHVYVCVCTRRASFICPFSRWSMMQNQAYNLKIKKKKWESTKANRKIYSQVGKMPAV